MGNVNTITRLADGRLRGDNTDYFGFQCLVEELGVEVAGKKVLVLGATGGAGTTASMVLTDLGATVVPVGRTSEVNYDNIAQQSDAALLVDARLPACPAARRALHTRRARCARRRYRHCLQPRPHGPDARGRAPAAPPASVVCSCLWHRRHRAVERYTGQVTPRKRILDVTERLSTVNRTSR